MTNENEGETYYSDRPSDDTFQKFWLRKGKKLTMPHDIEIADEVIQKAMIAPHIEVGHKVQLKRNKKAFYLIIEIRDDNKYLCQKLEIIYGARKPRYERLEIWDVLTGYELRRLPLRKVKL